MWPFNRRRAEESPREAPVPYAPARGEWRHLPPLQRMVGDQWLVNPPDSLSSGLASWQDPTYLAPLGHAVIPRGPSGSIEPAPSGSGPAEPRRIDLQRNAKPNLLSSPKPVHPLQRAASDPAPEAARHGPAALPPGDLDSTLTSTPVTTPVIHLPAEFGGVPMHHQDLETARSGPVPDLQRAVSGRQGPQTEGPLSPAPGASAAPPPVRPVAPFALQRMLIGDREIGTGTPAPSASTLSYAASDLPSLLASTDPPERRELPVVPAPRLSAPTDGRRPAPTPTAQRDTRPTGDTAPLLGTAGLAANVPESPEVAIDSFETPAPDDTPLPVPPQSAAVGPLVAQRSGTPDSTDLFAQPDGESSPLSAPLIGEVGLAAPMVQTSREATVPAEPQGPMPIAPLIADQPRSGPTAERGVQRLGLGSPVSGPLSDSALVAQRSSASRPGPQPSAPGEPRSDLRSSATGPGSSQLSLQRSGSTPPATGPGLPASMPAALGPPASSVQMVAPDSSGPPARPLPPPVMVMRSAPTDAVPSVSRSIEAPESLYAPDPFPEAPLLGLRPMDGGFAADRSPATTGSPASEPGTAAVQRSTWSHMPTPSPRADFPLPSSPESFGGAAAGSVALAPTPAVQRFASAASASTGSVGELRAAQRQEAAEPLPVVAAPVSLQSVPTQSVSPQTLTEVPPPHVEAVVQRVAAPPPSITVQAADAAPATAPATAGAAPAADPAALLAVLYEPLVRRLRADLRVDRERRGRLTDL
jgi:hypothetical protein